MTAPLALKEFFSRFQSISYRKREIIIRPEDKLQGVYYIATGYIRMYHIYENGKELTLNIFKPGSYFPMSWAISNVPNTYFFQALTDVTINRAPKKDVLKLLHSDPAILFELTSRIIVGFYGLLSNLERLFSAKAGQRVIAMLLILSSRFGKKEGIHKVKITLPLSHEDIALLTGLTRETTSVEMKKLMEQGLIYYSRRHIVVNNVKTLQSQCFI